MLGGASGLEGDADSAEAAQVENNSPFFFSFFFVIAVEVPEKSPDTCRSLPIWRKKRVITYRIFSAVY